MSTESVVLVPEWIADLFCGGYTVEDLHELSYWHNRVIPVELVCVVHNGEHSSCTYWYTPEEFEEQVKHYFNLPQCGLFWEEAGVIHELSLPYVKRLEPEERLEEAYRGA